MPDAREDARKQYAKTRSEFEKLDPQDKTAFVVEATFTTIGQAIEETGRQFADVLERVANYDFSRWERTETPGEAPNPAEPPTAKKRAPTPRPKRKADEDEPAEDE